MQTTADKITPDFLRNKLKLKSLEIKNNFYKKYPHVEKFFNDRGLELSKIREHSAKLISTGAITGSLLLASPVGVLPPPTTTEMIKNFEEPMEETLLNLMKAYLPQKIGPLERTQEKSL